jgi:hypothetical protein
LERENLKILTTISFFIALVTVLMLLVTLITPAKVFALTFPLTLIGIPLSIISMFSRERLAKRLFALVGNLLPVSLFTYAFIIEFIDEFYRAAP